jgi:hypothetical protein
MKTMVPTNLRRPEERYAALKVADALLRADRRRQRHAAMPKPTIKKAAPTVAGPQPIRLVDLRRALAARDSRLQSATNRAGGPRRNKNGESE